MATNTFAARKREHSEITTLMMTPKRLPVFMRKLYYRLKNLAHASDVPVDMIQELSTDGRTLLFWAADVDNGEQLKSYLITALLLVVETVKVVRPCIGLLMPVRLKMYGIY